MNGQPDFLPMAREETDRLGIDQLDIILVTGDAYIDHPSFGTALLGRVLWDAGFSVGIIAQPDWRIDTDLQRLGPPRLFFSISAGNVDSMVNAFTPNLKRRSSDVYSPGGRLLRPDRATLVYTDRVHALFPGAPIVIGGIEASLRRFAHYDYGSDSVRQPTLADAPADLLVFGMGERQVVTIARRLAMGEAVDSVTDVPGTAYKLRPRIWRDMDHADCVILPGYEEVRSDRVAYARAFAAHYHEQDPLRGRRVAQPHPKTVIIQNPPAMPLTTTELDRVYELPYARAAHPSYTEPVAALEPVRFSVVSHRGCFGSCSFCALTHHQGRIIQSRSPDSIVREVERMAAMPEFAGVVQDVGGPTANMYGIHCDQWDDAGTCPDRRCIDCPALDRNHDEHLRLLKRLRDIPGVKHVFIASGIRYDLIPPGEYLDRICKDHVSGHLKVAPEHVSEGVCACMGKPPREVFDAFRGRFETLQEGREKRQYLIPYFISGHPGCRIADMVELAEYVRDTGLYTEQVQDFTPTPMSISTAIYHTGLDPFTLEEVYVPKGREKRIQRALIHYRDPENYGLVREGLRAAGREDLVGNAWKCLVPARRRRSSRAGRGGSG